MGKLQMCRICLAEDFRLFEVDNKDLQHLYETLSNFPFITEDSRPMLACVFCYTRLKQCCQLQRKCLEAEKLFTQMLNEDDEIKPLIKQGLVEFTNSLIISPVAHINITDENDSETNNIAEIPIEFEDHFDNVNVKEENEAELDPEYRYEEYVDNCPDVKDMPTNDPESDSEDDTPLIEFKTEVEEEVTQKIPRITKKRSSSDAKKPELYVQLTRQEDTMTFQQKKTEQTDSTIIWNKQKRSSTAGSKLVTNSKQTSNSVKNTAISTNDRKYKYKCDICPHRATKKYNLINHIRSHTGEKPYKCEICQKSFSRTHHLNRHSRTHSDEKKGKQKNTVTAVTELKKSVTTTSVANKNSPKERIQVKNGEKPHKCDRCHLTTHNRKYFLFHIRTKHGQSYKCDICSRTYNQKEKLIRHIRAHTGENPYKCEICQKSFRRRYHLNRHSRTHSGEKKEKQKNTLTAVTELKKSVTSTSVDNKNSIPHNGEKPFKCDGCPKSYITSLGLKNHIINEHAGEKIYECDICKRGYADKNCLKNHMKLHDDEKPFQCDKCGRSFKTKIQLKKHFLSHTKEKRLKCEICGRGFNSKELFLNHMGRHNGDLRANYQCEKCGKGFALRICLRTHIRTSACWGHKNLVSCSVCQRGFNTSSSLNRHMRCHTKEKPYKCDECQSSFREKTKLVIHKRLHSGENPFECHLCPMSFRVKSSLKRHVYLHSGEKPYKCDVCQRSFAFTSDLKRHIQTHDIVKSFKCEFCPKSFTQSSSRNVHVQKAHQKTESAKRLMKPSV